MTWHILGAGSIGALWACRLAEAGLNPCLILRSAEKLNRYQRAQGLHFGSKTAPYRISAQLAHHPSPINRLVLSCKAYDALSAIQSVAHRLSADAEVVLLQNGLGSQDEVKAALGGVRCILGSSTEGAYRLSEFHVIPAGAGLTSLGDPDNSVSPAWLAELHNAGIHCQWQSDISAKLWHKLALNCAINPLTVLNNCKNGELLNQPMQLEPLCNELKQLLWRSGQFGPDYPLFEDVQRVLAATGQNYSSMHQDVANRRRTENHYLLGYALRHAQHLTLELPQLEMLYQRLSAHLHKCGLPTD